ncbi:hypothetical protein A1OE_1412 [Candidatus Endolissoclinum faulkneri L2]|uniref:Uncharacterized protein n=1 Tax=Candidatus Endolissoclinum faulkneri L2 TaxID=1193729 RepID=K7ZDJ5_9PROT|nr:hypothetical protein A1OE_1412 [Candidatus Endolissoclinum faulkneri L2]
MEYSAVNLFVSSNNFIISSQETKLLSYCISCILINDLCFLRRKLKYAICYRPLIY